MNLTRKNLEVSNPLMLALGGAMLMGLAGAVCGESSDSSEVESHVKTADALSRMKGAAIKEFVGKITDKSVSVESEADADRYASVQLRSVNRIKIGVCRDMVREMYKTEALLIATARKSYPLSWVENTTDHVLPYKSPLDLWDRMDSWFFNETVLASEPVFFKERYENLSDKTQNRLSKGLDEWTKFNHAFAAELFFKEGFSNPSDEVRVKSVLEEIEVLSFLKNIRPEIDRFVLTHEQISQAWILDEAIRIASNSLFVEIYDKLADKGVKEDDIVTEMLIRLMSKCVNKVDKLKAIGQEIELALS